MVIAGGIPGAKTVSDPLVSCGENSLEGGGASKFCKFEKVFGRLAQEILVVSRIRGVPFLRDRDGG